MGGGMRLAVTLRTARGLLVERRMHFHATQADLQDVEGPEGIGDPLLRCPNRNNGKHPPPDQNEFMVLALIRVGPHFGFRRVQDHFLDDVLCRECGEDAEGTRD